MRPAYRLCALLSFLIPCFATSARARVFFADERVFTRDKSIDLSVWRVAPQDGDSGWTCDSASAPAFHLAACSVRPYARGASPRDEYLYWAFLNLAPVSDRTDLKPQNAEQRAFYDSLRHPLLALKQKQDSCTYLVAFRDEYAPLAAGRVACPDLAAGLAAVNAELGDRARLIPREWDDKSGKEVLKSGQFSSVTPNALDFGIDFAAGMAIPLSSDYDKGDPPFTQHVERFDFGDFADLDAPPLSVAGYLLYHGAIGLRVAYAYSTYSLDAKLLDALKQGFAQQGNTLQSWAVQRRDLSGEILAGHSFTGKGSEVGLYAIFGLDKVGFHESVKMNGQTSNSVHSLKNETGVLLGAGAGFRFLGHVSFGFEGGLLLKDFRLNNTTEQPDGTGNEIHLRLRLGGFERILLGSP